MTIVAAVLLGAVFVLSGVTKVAAPRRWLAQAGELGVPAWTAAPLPYVELTIGAFLVAQVARRWLAVVAGVLLVAFTALLVVRLRQGRRPPCACFGGWSTRPISWRHVARNAVFVALAVIVAARG